MRTAVIEWLRMHAAQLTLAGKQAVRVIVQLLVGVVLGAMLAFYSAHARPAGGPLTVCSKGAVRMSRSPSATWSSHRPRSRRSIRCSPAFPVYRAAAVWCAFAVGQTLVVTTFVVGLLPVIGNLISNTLIFVSALSVSLWLRSRRWHS